MPIEAVVTAPVNAPAPTDTATTQAAPTIEAAKAARRDANPPATPKAEETKPVTAEIEMDADQLKAATQLSREAREAKTKLKELEPKVASAAKLEQAQALAKEGKHLQAMELLGIDLNAAVQEQLTIPGEAGETVDPRLAALTKDLEDIKASEKSRADREAAQTAEQAKAAAEADIKKVAEFVKADATKYPYLSRNDAWVSEAYDTAAKEYPTLVKEAGRPLTPQERHNLTVAALEEAEAKHAETAKLYGASVTSNDLTDRQRAQPSKPSARPTTFDSSMRGGTVNPVTKTKTKATLEDVKRQRRANA